MGLLKEFRDFALRGNVFDMAVGVIIGAAFGKIVTSLVNDVITPPLGMALGKANFADLSHELGVGADGKPVLLKYGAFVQTILDFTIIAFCILMIVKGVNKLVKKAPPPPPPGPTPDQQLLAEIRDLLKART